MRVLFLGSDPIALPALEWLAGEGRKVAELAAVFTAPDRPAGRGQVIRPNAIKAWAKARGLPVSQPEKLGDADVARVKDLGTDVSLVMAYGQILREPFIAAPRLATLNLHASLLPKYRGASPIQTAIASGERETGVCLMKIVRRLDAGPVADGEKVPIGRLDTAADIENRLSSACPKLLARTLPRVGDGSLFFEEQDESAASYCRRLRKEDGVLDWSQSAGVLAARINGLFPWPGCSIEIAGTSVKVGLAEMAPVSPSAPEAPGTIIGNDGEAVRVQAGDGLVRLLRLQRSGGRMLPAPEFLRGFPFPANTLLASHPMPPLVSTQPFR